MTSILNKEYPLKGSVRMANIDDKPDKMQSNTMLKELDMWIEQLYEKKQLAENQVKTLCEKVWMFYLLRGGGGGWGFKPIILETLIMRYGLKGKAWTRPDFFRVVLGPCSQFYPCETSEQK